MAPIDNPDSLQEDVVGQPIDELVESRKYSEFVESYSIDDIEAATHKARRSRRKSRWEPILGIGLMIALFASMIYLFLDGPYSAYLTLSVFIAASGLISIRLLLDGASIYQARKSEVTDRDLICYEAEGAIEQYQKEDYEGVYQYLSAIDNVLVRGHEQGVSSRMRRWLRTYLHRVENSEDRETAIEGTFDRLAVYLVDDLEGTREAEIYDIIGTVDVEEKEKEESSGRRALIDAWKTARSVVTSRYGIIGFSFLIAGFVYFALGRETIAVAIPGLILAIYQVW